MKKKILILDENNNYIILCKKTAFLSTITFQFLFHFRGGRRLPLFNGVFFAQEIPKELIPLSVDYDVALRLTCENNYSHYMFLKVLHRRCVTRF